MIQHRRNAAYSCIDDCNEYRSTISFCRVDVSSCVKSDAGASSIAVSYESSRTYLSRITDNRPLLSNPDRVAPECSQEEIANDEYVNVM